MTLNPSIVNIVPIIISKNINNEGFSQGNCEGREKERNFSSY